MKTELEVSTSEHSGDRALHVREGRVADVFGGPVERLGCVLFNADRKALLEGCGPDDDARKYVATAAHAINCHDVLVRALENAAGWLAWGAVANPGPSKPEGRRLLDEACNDARAALQSAQSPLPSAEGNDAAQGSCSADTPSPDPRDALIEELRGALRPFAREAEEWAARVPDDHSPRFSTEYGDGDCCFTIGDLRGALAAYNRASLPPTYSGGK